MYGSVQRMIVIAFVVAAGVNALPLIFWVPLILAFTLPVSAALVYRQYLYAQRKKAKADMLFGPEAVYSTEELMEFFDIPTERESEVSYESGDNGYL
jgi:membrane protein implicated in regulation of membrane protease activity